MPRRKTPADRFRVRLETLSRSIQANLRLPSLEENRLEGYAYSFRIVLPLFNAEGKQVFTDLILKELFKVLDDRFGGCMMAASSSAPPLWGLWHPGGLHEPHSTRTGRSRRLGAKGEGMAQRRWLFTGPRSTVPRPPNGCPSARWAASPPS